MFEEAHILPLQSGGFWVVGRTSQGYLGASSTRDPTARAGWTKTGVATYWYSQTDRQTDRQHFSVCYCGFEREHTKELILPRAAAWLGQGRRVKQLDFVVCTAGIIAVRQRRSCPCQGASSRAVRRGYARRLG